MFISWMWSKKWKTKSPYSTIVPKKPSEAKCCPTTPTMCTLKFGKRCWRPGCDRYVASVLDFCTSMVIQTWWQIVLKTTAWLARLAKLQHIIYFSLDSLAILKCRFGWLCRHEGSWRKIMLLFSLETQVASYVSLRSGCEGHDGHVCYLGPQLWVSPSHAPDLTIVRPTCSNWSGKFRYQAISVWIITSWPAPYLLFVLFLSCASSWVILIYHVCCTATPSAVLPRNWLNPSFRPLQNFQFLHLSESETLALGEELSLNLSAYFPAPSNIWIFDFRHPLLHISPLSHLLARQKQWQFGATRFGPSDHKKWVATNYLVGRAMVCVANTLERSACASSLLESFLPSSQRGPKEAPKRPQRGKEAACIGCKSSNATHCHTSQQSMPELRWAETPWTISDTWLTNTMTSRAYIVHTAPYYRSYRSYLCDLVCIGMSCDAMCSYV